MSGANTRLHVTVLIFAIFAFSSCNNRVVLDQLASELGDMFIGDGVTDNSDIFDKVIESASSGEKIRIEFKKGDFRIARDLEIPKNLSLVLSSPAALVPDDGVTVTIKGNIEAGNYQVFAGKGTVIGPGNATIYPVWYGAKGDGKTDDTLAIRAAMQEGKEIIFAGGTFLVEATTSKWGDLSGGIAIPSNVTVRMSPSTVIRAKPTASQRYTIFVVHGRENVTVIGGTIQGERNEHLGTTGEWGYGIAVGDSKNVTLQDITAKDCWGDGFVIGSSTAVKMIGCVADNNRRQGLSIVGGNKLDILNCRFINTNGTAPQSGIDIEPDSGMVAEEISISESEFVNNQGLGLSIVADRGRVGDVKFSNNKITSSPWCVFIKQPAGNILLQNNTIFGCKEYGIRVLESPQVVIKGGSIFENKPNISLVNTDHALIEEVQIISSKSCGISLTASDNNTIRNNYFAENAKGDICADNGTD